MFENKYILAAAIAGGVIVAGAIGYGVKRLCCKKSSSKCDAATAHADVNEATANAG